MKELVEYIVRNLVDQPEAVVVGEGIARDESRLIELQVAEEDRGKVIGRKGRTAHAIRVLLNAATANQGQVRLDILD